MKKLLFMMTLVSTVSVYAVQKQGALSAQAERAVADLVYECTLKLSQETLDEIRTVLSDAKRMMDYALPLQKRGMSLDQIQNDKKLVDLTQKFFLGAQELSVKILLDLQVDPGTVEGAEELEFFTAGMKNIAESAGLNPYGSDELQQNQIMSAIIGCALKHLEAQKK